MGIFNFQFSIFKKIAAIVLLLIGCFLLFINSAFAYSAEVRVRSGRESINALEGKIVIPSGVTIDEVSTGNSTILIWVKPPSYDAQSGTISFSGITPGGFSGDRSVLEISGNFSPNDLQAFTFESIQAFKSDGSGDKISVAMILKEKILKEDSDPPEPFTPVLSSSNDLLEGKRFVSFATQDKGRGVKSYEYASTWLFAPNEEGWRETQSPLLLSGSQLFKKIHIRALDAEENARVASISAPYRYATIIFGIIIILCALLYLRRSFRSYS